MSPVFGVTSPPVLGSQELEKHRGEASDGAALAIFRQLRRLNVTVDTLKATRTGLRPEKTKLRDGSYGVSRERYGLESH